MLGIRSGEDARVVEVDLVLDADGVHRVREGALESTARSDQSAGIALALVGRDRAVGVDEVARVPAVAGEGRTRERDEGSEGDRGVHLGEEGRRTGEEERRKRE